MNWLWRQRVGTLALLLAVAALALGVSAYRCGAERDGQLRGQRVSEGRGAAELAERYRKGAAALDGLADPLRTLAFSAAAAAVTAGVWDARRRSRLWLAGVVVIVAAGTAGLAMASRAEPGAAPDPDPRAGRADDTESR